MRILDPFGPQDLGFERDRSGVAQSRRKYGTDSVLYVAKIEPALAPVIQDDYFLK
jgi:hypothetical protein